MAVSWKARRVSRSMGGNITLFVFLGLLSAFMVLPLVFVVVNAFKPLNELFVFPPKFYI